MKKAVIFDFDYTLGDSTEGIVASTEYALRKMSEKMCERQEIINTVGLSLEETYTALTGKSSDEERNVFRQLFIKKADEVMVDSTVLYDKTLFVLDSLKKAGLKTGIVTTKFNSRIQNILKKFEAENLIDVIVGAENVKNKKPHPEGLITAVEKLSFRKEDVIYIGDSFVDAMAAQSAEMDFIGVLTGTTDKEKFLKYKNICICEDIENAYSFVINNCL